MTNRSGHVYQATDLLYEGARSLIFRRRRDDGEPEEDTFDRFINNDQFPDKK